MPLFNRVTLIATLVSISTVAAHGTVGGIVADRVYYLGYNPSLQYMSPPPSIVAWSTPADLDIICHKLATPGGVEAPIKVGAKLEFQWTPWPTSYHGPVLDYMANCIGPCEAVDKTTLEWFKIDQKGLVSGSNPGTWATDTLIANNNSWTVTIPPTLKTGNCVIRHEIIALHAAAAPGDHRDRYRSSIWHLSRDLLHSIRSRYSGKHLPDAVVLYYPRAVWSGGVTMSQTLPAAHTSTGVGIHNVK